MGLTKRVILTKCEECDKKWTLVYVEIDYKRAFVKLTCKCDTCSQYKHMQINFADFVTLSRLNLEGIHE